MDKTTRVGDGKVRHHFRTVQEGDLPTRVCAECRTLEYACANGVWLHWQTLTTEHARGALEGQEGGVS